MIARHFPATSPPIGAPDPQPVIAVLQPFLERGVRWQDGSNDPVSGFSCFGLVWFAFQQAGIMLPCSPLQAESLFYRVVKPYQPWDVLVCRFPMMLMHPRHLLLLLHPTWGYHSSSATNGLARFSLAQAPWRRVIQHGMRYQGFSGCT